MPPTPADPPLNPYEAPQARELLSALFVAPKNSSGLLEVPPPEVRRWMCVSLVVYGVSMVVPYAPWLENRDGSQFASGLKMFLAGFIFFWHPYMLSWWANLLFWLTWRRLNMAQAGKALALAILCVVISGTSLYIAGAEIRVPHHDSAVLPAPLLDSIPYYCWLASLGLMLFAAIKLWRFQSRSAPAETSDG